MKDRYFEAMLTDISEKIGKLDMYIDDLQIDVKKAMFYACGCVYADRIQGDDDTDTPRREAQLLRNLSDRLMSISEQFTNAADTLCMNPVQIQKMVDGFKDAVRQLQNAAEPETRDDDPVITEQPSCTGSEVSDTSTDTSPKEGEPDTQGRTPQNENGTEMSQDLAASSTTETNLTSEEDTEMATPLRLQIKGTIVTAHTTVRKDGLYQIRVRYEKKEYMAVAKTEELAAGKLIAKIEEQIAQTEKQTKNSGCPGVSSTTDTHFTAKEYREMVPPLRQMIKIGKITPHTTVRKDGLYQVRVRYKKVEYLGVGKTERLAVEKFIVVFNKDIAFELGIPYPPYSYAGYPAPSPTTQFPVNPAVTASPTVPATPAPPASAPENDPVFATYAKTWLEKVKKPIIKESTYEGYRKLFDAHITKAFQDKRLSQITQLDVQELINEQYEKGQFRTAKSIFQLLKSIFDYAVVDRIIPNSPMTRMRVRNWEQKESVPLSRDEEKTLVQKLLAAPDNAALQACVFIMYTGLRRSEFFTATIEGDFVKADCAKCRLGSKQKTRLIPITPMLRKVLPYIDLESAKNMSADNLTKQFSSVMEGHHLHELRHTFITRCQECGARREYVSLWAGHEPDSSITTTIYTHLEQNKQIQLEEASKVDYEL